VGSFINNHIKNTPILNIPIFENESNRKAYERLYDSFFIVNEKRKI